MAILRLTVALVLFPLLTGAAFAVVTGNRVNGVDVQPTPQEIHPAERQAHVAPSPKQRRAEDRTLQRIDRKALRQEGMSPKSVPNLAKQPPHK